MAARYTNISESFPEDIDRNTLPFFMDWIKHNVILVEIIAYSDENAYTIFETMNDRGLNLTPTEMLKGFMLSKFKDPAKRIKANEIWRDSIKSLHEWDKDEDQRFLQAWLRSQYAETIRPGKAGSKNEDFEKIGTRFHSWVRDNLDKVGLASGTADDFDRFINEDFCFYNRNYIKLLEATSSLSNFNEHVYYMSFWGIAPTLGYPLILSPLKLGDDEGLIAQKMNIVAKYIESFSVRRAVNFRNFSASSIRYTMYMLVKELRGKDVKTLTSILSEKLNSMEESFDGMDDFRLHGQNKYFVRFLLSRMTSFIEKECKINSSFSSYMGESSSKPFEIEHIWADKFSEHRGEFDQENQFNEYRNRIGALILLPNGTNQSFSDKPYSEKVGHYIKENALAQSLCSLNYQNNPNFTGMMSRLNLHFEPHCQFKKEDIIKRQALYIDICKKIWPDDLSSCLVEQQ
jgi:hypothetical protein